MVFVYRAVITNFIGCPVQVFQLGGIYPFYNIHSDLVMELCAIVISEQLISHRQLGTLILLQHSTPSQPISDHSL